MNEPRNIDPEPPPPVSISTPHIQKASHGTSRVLFFHDESSNPGKQFNPRHPVDFGRGLTESPCPKGWKLPFFYQTFCLTAVIKFSGWKRLHRQFDTNVLAATTTAEALPGTSNVKVWKITYKLQCTSPLPPLRALTCYLNRRTKVASTLIQWKLKRG